jgi:UDP-2,4-diacetamido-2,4,6-trideoxy-beta-L-altropyranose hydrolase
MKYDFGIRIDIDEETGYGHFFRCFSISKELEKNGKTSLFLIKDEKEFLKHTKGIIKNYQVLGNFSEKECIKKCKKVKNFESLIVDLPNHNELYSKSFENICKTAIIDDIGNKNIHSEILFNGSIVKKYQNYRIKKNTKLYQGTKYMIIRKEFEQIKSRIKLNKKIKNILIIFGGTTKKDWLEEILRFFFEKNYHITVVLGASYEKEYFIKLKQKFEKFQIEYSIHEMAELFAKQDLVIASSGIISYELACLGIPVIFMPVVIHQEPTAIEMANNGFGVNYGVWDSNTNRFDQVLNNLEDYKIREDMFYSGRKIVDGKGVLRIVKNLMNF